MKRIVLLLLGATASAWAYVPEFIPGLPLHRIYYSTIQFLVSQNIAAGMTNAAGTVWITPDSAPMAAINGAIATWNGVPTTGAHFLPVQPTSLSYNLMDSSDQINFTDDAVIETLTAGVLAVTTVKSTSTDTTTIIGSDVFFSPAIQFSTTLATGTYDIQAVLTHELGHSLGANHTNVLSATMYYMMGTQDTHAQTLSADDIAFVSSLYPGGAYVYGTISGVATVAGSPLMGGMLTAVDPNTGVTVGGYSSFTDGSFSFQVPPGNYYVYVEPAFNINLYYATPQTVPFTSFRAAFSGGNSQPSLVQVQAGATVTANMDASAGATSLLVPYAGIGIAGTTGDFHGALSKLPQTISSGQSVDFLFSSPFSGTITESNLQVIGAANLRPGSLRRDTINLSDGTPVYRFTLDIPSLTANASATLVIRNGSDILTRSGLFDLTRPQSVNAGSYLGGPVAPGEILSFFGPQLGPASPVNNGGFDSTGHLPVTLGGITVSFGQVQAPLFYVSNSQINLQVPYEISGQSSALMNVYYNGTTIATSTLNVANSAPGIFVVTNADGSVNGPNAQSPAGGVLVIYGTGAGVTSGLLQTGAAAPANSTVAATVTIGGASVTPIYAGLTPGSVGLTQVNVAIPPGTPSSSAIPLQFSMNGVATQTVNIAVK